MPPAEEMPGTVRPAGRRDLSGVMAIVEKTIALMTAENNPQWSPAYPAREDFLSDIDAGTLYVLDEGGRVAAFICVNRIAVPEYRSVVWNSDRPYFVIHRLAVHPERRRDGAGAWMIGFAERHAEEHGAYTMRTDTFSGNRGMNHLLQKCGYRRTGEVFFRGISAPFYCYDKAW